MLSSSRKSNHNNLKNLTTSIDRLPRYGLRALKNTKKKEKEQLDEQNVFQKSVQAGHTQKIKEQVQQKIDKYLQQKRTNFLKARLCQYYGRNYPVNYKSHYKFQEQWEQNLGKKQKYQNDYIYTENNLQITSAVILIIVYTISLWFSNLQQFFSSDHISQTQQIIFVILIITIVLDCFFKIKFRLQRKLLSLNYCNILRQTYKQLICICVFALKITAINDGSSFWWTTELIVTYYLYTRISELYQTIRFLKFRLYHTYQSKIIDLILTLLIILHIVAITLFVSTKAGYSDSWINQISMTFDRASPYLHYLYSFYFSSTTILTIGYGDFTPKNPLQVGVVILVQIFGVIMFAYLISEIGYSISTLRKGREVVQNDLSIMQKMRKHYKMNDQLSKQASSYIINHKPNSNLLQPTEESSILLKFNQSLRNDIINSNKLAVVKSSIFFLTRWSQAFQRSIAKKITHILFSPNDIIYQPAGQERIYLIKTGSVNVYAQRNGRKKGCNNILKVISCSVQKQVADNCYGYTAVISTRPSRLYAYSKDFTSAYFIDKENFLACANELAQDFQLYHEILNKIDQSECWESHEVPALDSGRHHYNPTTTILIKKYIKSLSRLTNNRKNTSRKLRNCFRGHKNMLRGNKQQILSKLSSLSSQVFDFIQEDSKKSIERNIQSSSLSSQQQELASIISKDIVTDWTQSFQCSREYNNFFMRNNLETVLKKYELQFYFMSNIQENMVKYRQKLYQSASYAPLNTKKRFTNNNIQSPVQLQSQIYQ